MGKFHEPLKSLGPGARDLLGNAAETGELRRRLTQRQLSMLAIGGAIGVGLFLGSSVTIRLAGPGVIVSYLLGAVIALIIAYALVEMAVVHPVAGSFGVYAQTYLSPWAGFTVRATYGLVQIIAIGAEVTAVAIYFAFWFPSIPQWIWVVGVSIGLVALNALQVARFGEFEYWFALIKVLTILVFIVVGLGLILGLGPRLAIGLSNLTAHGGFLPYGWRGVWLALTLALTSYMGVEIIAVSAGEAERPEESIPRAMRTIVFRLILFYVLAITVMLAMTPWNHSGTGTGITGSPFVSAFTAVGIPYGASIMNLVVITAALSSSNTDLYLSTRMLFSLSRGRYAPEWLGRLSENGVPRHALAVSTGGMVAAILLAIYAPAKAFLMLYGVAVAGMFFVWIIILLTHLAFRRALAPERIARLPMRLRFFPYSTCLGIAALLGIAVSTFYVQGLQYSVPAFAPILLLISLAYWKVRRGKGFARGMERQ
ncbi:MAG TPA: amino acid permease [Candidatus Polarisedimenticolia bacterium]|nr:amino acid permease [Candidatus Polarisedimenticolia bacterium]